MSKPLHAVLSRRERAIMDILYQLGRATAADLVRALPGGPSDSTVRTQLRVLEAKGHVRHEDDGVKYVYYPVVPRRVVRKSALKHVMNTFFEGSAEKVVAALLGPDGGKLSDDELDRIAEIVAKARAEESK
ncbi:MAG TPA: BlaI/MecI/CopY family transcriptional regulator [Vicinamibacterales bacterium]